jgi:virginiamycin B lyase
MNFSRVLPMLLCSSLSVVTLQTQAMDLSGTVQDGKGAAIEGAMVTLSAGEPAHSVSVFANAQGAYNIAGYTTPGPYELRVRRIGWKDHRQPIDEGAESLALTLQPETDPALLAAQLPANRWYGLLLANMDDEVQREELVRQCTYCHQQGNLATRQLRDEEEWRKVLALMARMGAGLSPELRQQVPQLFNEAYAPETAVAALTANRHDPDFAPPPSHVVQRSVTEEWVLGHAASMQHDLVVHPDGRVYSVDMTQDQLYRLDTRGEVAIRDAWKLPHGDLPPGGVFGNGGLAPPNANAHVGPHSLQVAPDGSIWITLALGNQLAKFDPATETFSTYPLEEGLYPHTLRIGGDGRVWYTVAASNHVGVYDPKTGDHDWIRLPAPTLGQEIASRMIPFFLWLSQYVDLSGAAESGEGGTAPVPYGIDIAANGDVWFSQLNAHRIGRIDPESFDVEIVDTPFTAPRRLRFDSQGKLWIPGFSSGLISRFDPETREFESWTVPIEPLGTETPYALNVDQRTDTVWICGTNSDTLISFDTRSEHFEVYPLPTRVTYTREIDFDDRGRVWTSNSNAPAWQIEDGRPRVLRLDPNSSAESVVVSQTLH